MKGGGFVGGFLVKICSYVCCQGLILLERRQTAEGGGVPKKWVSRAPIQEDVSQKFGTNPRKLRFGKTPGLEPQC